MTRYKAYFLLRHGLTEVREYLFETKHFSESEFAAIMENIADEAGVTFAYYEEIRAEVKEN